MKIDLPGYGNLTEPEDHTEYYAVSRIGGQIYCQECKHRSEDTWDKKAKMAGS